MAESETPRAPDTPDEEKRSRGGVQGKPRTPSGKRETWKPPAKPAPPINRDEPAPKD